MTAQVRASDRVPTWQEAVILRRLLNHAQTHEIAEAMLWYFPNADERTFLPSMAAADWVIEWMGTYTLDMTAGVAALDRYEAARAPGVGE